jgi:hypothetical protein
MHTSRAHAVFPHAHAETAATGDVKLLQTATLRSVASLCSLLQRLSAFDAHTRTTTAGKKFRHALNYLRDQAGSRTSAP